MISNRKRATGVSDKQRSRVRISKLAAMTACVFAVGGALGGCGSSSSPKASAPTSTSSAASSTSTSAAPVTVNYLTDFVASGFYVPIFYAKQLGYYQREGISLNVTYGTGSETTAEAVSAGKFLIGDAGAATVPVVDEKGGNVVSVGAYIGKPTYGFWVPKASNVTSIAQLKGKSVLVSPGDFGSLMLPGILAAAGLAPNAVTKVSVAGSDKLSAYAQGTGFAYEGSLPYSSPAIQGSRPSRALPFSTVGFPGPDTVFLVKRGTDPSIVKRFLTATYMGVAASLKNPTAALASFMATNPPIKEAVANGQFRAFFFQYFCGAGMQGEPNGYQVPSDWSKLVNLLVKYEHLSASSALSFYTNADLPSTASVSPICP